MRRAWALALLSVLAGAVDYLAGGVGVGAPAWHLAHRARAVRVV